MTVEIIKRRSVLAAIRGKLENIMWAESDWVELGRLVRAIKVVDGLMEATLWATPR